MEFRILRWLQILLSPIFTGGTPFYYTIKFSKYQIIILREKTMIDKKVLRLTETVAGSG